MNNSSCSWAIYVELFMGYQTAITISSHLLIETSPRMHRYGANEWCSGTLVHQGLQIQMLARYQGNHSTKKTV